MPVILEGVLTIKSVQGTRGAFSVGDLATEVGNFRIKDALLDEYEPGQYRGKFVVSQIFPTSYTWRGKVSVEVRARLQEILLDTAVAPTSPAPAIEHEPDPLDEERPLPIPAQPVPADPSKPSLDATKPEVVGTGPQPDTLFGADVQAMIDAGGAVKLDPTVARDVFRQQRDALKQQGFRFDPKAQHWTK